MSAPSSPTKSNHPLVGKRGMIFVRSKITAPDVLDDATFSRWYEDEHIPETVATSGVRSGLRALACNRSQDRPFLAAYTLDDLAFIASPEFSSISVDSDILPGDENAYAMVDFHIGFFPLVDVVDPTGKGKESAKTIVATQWELPEGVTDEALGEWYRGEHAKALSSIPGFLRALRFRYAGEYTSGGGGGDTKCPTWLELVELETPSPPAGEGPSAEALVWDKWEGGGSGGGGSGSGSGSRPKGLKLERPCVAYGVVGFWGEKEFFH